MKRYISKRILYAIVILCLFSMICVSIQIFLSTLNTPKNPDEVRLAVVQFNPVKEKAKNLEKIEYYITEAGEKDIDLIVFPELITTYYVWNNQSEYTKYYRENAETIPGETSNRIANLSKKYNMYVCWGMVEKSNTSENLYNTQVLAGPDGQIIATYRKIHLTEYENDVFTSGEEIRVYNTSIGKIGIMICRDRRFPELARTYSLLGADILIIGAATSSRVRDTFILPAMAYENSVWVIFANEVGVQPGKHSPGDRPLIYHGDSQIIDPFGEIRIKASGYREEMVWIAVNRDELRLKNELVGERKPEVYSKVPVIYDIPSPWGKNV